MISLSIIIPTFNDGKIIRKKILFLIKKIKKLKINYEIIIINDGSIDNTKLEILSIKNKKIFLINNSKNKGKSFSIKKGLKKSRFKHVILIDSDLPYFSKFNLIVSKLKENYDFIFINRRHFKSKVKNNNFNFYKIFRYLAGYIISILLKLTIDLDTGKIDTQAGLKGFKKIKNFNDLKFISNKFFLDIELIYLYTKLSKKIISIPVIYKISSSSSIKIFNIKKNIEILFELLKVVINISFEKKQF